MSLVLFSLAFIFIIRNQFEPFWQWATCVTLERMLSFTTKNHQRMSLCEASQSEPYTIDLLVFCIFPCWQKQEWWMRVEHFRTWVRECDWESRLLAGKSELEHVIVPCFYCVLTWREVGWGHSSSTANLLITMAQCFDTCSTEELVLLLI